MGSRHSRPDAGSASGLRTLWGLGAFRSPAYAFSRAVAEEEYVAHFSLTHQGQRGRPEWYYVRVRQVNGQWAWTSPVWVTGA